MIYCVLNILFSGRTSHQLLWDKLSKYWNKQTIMRHTERILKQRNYYETNWVNIETNKQTIMTHTKQTVNMRHIILRYWLDDICMVCWRIFFLFFKYRISSRNSNKNVFTLKKNLFKELKLMMTWFHDHRW